MGVVAGFKEWRVFVANRFGGVLLVVVHFIIKKLFVMGSNLL